MFGILVYVTSLAAATLKSHIVPTVLKSVDISSTKTATVGFCLLTSLALPSMSTTILVSEVIEKAGLI